MADYVDDSGSYSGELKDGFPHGKGIKIYKSGEIYDGNWKKGCKHGVGVLEIDELRMRLKYSHGVPVKILDFPIERLGNQIIIHLFFSSSFRPFGNFYKEYLLNKYDALEGIYLLIYNPIVNKICFRSKLIKNFESSFFTGKSGYIEYAIEKRDGIIKGLFEISIKNLSYLGQGENCIPEGKGKIYSLDGTKISGSFTKGLLQGKGQIKNKDFNSNCNFIDGIPYGNIQFKYQNIPGNFFVDHSSIGILEISSVSKETEKFIGILFKNAINYIKTFKELYTRKFTNFNIVLEKIISKINKYEKKLDKHTIKSDFNFKGYKSWNDYENKKSLSSGFEKVVRGKEVYIGETPKGKGKILFSNGEKYKGEVVNGNIHGFGKYWYKDEKIYLGEFFKGKKHGIGMMAYRDNHYYKGNWQYDNMIRQGILKNKNQAINVFTKASNLENFIGIF